MTENGLGKTNIENSNITMNNTKIDDEESNNTLLINVVGKLPGDFSNLGGRRRNMNP